MKTCITFVAFGILLCGCQRPGTPARSSMIGIADTAIRWDSARSFSHFTGGFRTDDGLILFYQGWQPVDSVKAVICLVHGFNEHSGRYAQYSELLGRCGFAVASFDLRGHGRSMGQRGHFPSLTAALNDISAFLSKTAKLYPGKKLFLYGHSLGGDFVINYALRFHPAVTGVIASAPMLKLAFQPPWWQQPLGNIMAAVWPSFSMPNPIAVQDVARDTAVQQSINDDPLIQHRVTAAFVGLIKAGGWAAAHANELPLPLLLMHGNADRITSEPASAEFARKAGHLCTFKVWPGFFHQIHEEPGKKAVVEYVTAWMDSTLRLTP